MYTQSGNDVNNYIVTIEVVYWKQLFSLQDGTTPLFIASQQGHSDVVNILIRNGADVNMAKEVKHSTHV